MEVVVGAGVGVIIIVVVIVVVMLRRKRKQRLARRGYQVSSPSKVSMEPGGDVDGAASAAYSRKAITTTRNDKKGKRDGKEKRDPADKKDKKEKRDKADKRDNGKVDSGQPKDGASQKLIGSGGRAAK